MKKVMILMGVLMFTGLTAFSQDKIVTKSSHINFFSHTSVEDISADNYSVVSALTPSTGELVFSVSMQSFEFKKALMQKHFNSPDFLDSKQFPKAKFKGKITNLADVDFTKDGTYKVTFDGELTIHGVTKKVTETGTVKVKGSTYTIETKMSVKLADYKIALKDGKPSKNVAKDIAITVKAEFK